MIVLALLHGTRLLPAWPAGIAAWVAGALLWPRLDRRQKRFALGLGALGALALGGALWRGQAPEWTRLLTQNTALLGMLGAVSFLQLVGLGAGADDLPRGARARWLPLALSAVVIAGHVWLPHWHSLGIISAAALALAAVAVFAAHGVREGAARLVHHAERRLPAMAGEMLLFLSAGVFATGLQALFGAQAGWMPFSHFGPLQAALLLAGMMLLSALGIHAVVSIVMVSAWLAPLSPDPLLLAMIFLQCWAIGLAANPMAGVHLSLQGRFGLSALALARGNLRYCMAAYGLCVLWLAVVGTWRGLW